jgi:hypothetical protein
MIMLARKAAVEEAEQKALAEERRAEEEIFKLNDLFLTENPCLEPPQNKSTTPKLTQPPSRIHQPKPLSRRPSKKKITIANNWDINAAQRSTSRSKVIVNFTMKKNELISNQIISNIRSILRSIETRNDKSLPQAQKSGAIPERRPLGALQVDSNRRIGIGAGQPNQTSGQINFSHLCSFSAHERSDSNIMRKPQPLINDLLIDRNIFSTKGRSTERNKYEREASKSEDRHQVTSILKKKQSVLKANKENAGPTSVIGTMAKLKSLKQIGAAALDSSISNQVQDRSSLVAHSKRQKAALTEMLVGNAILQASQSASRRQKFLIRSNTNHPADRKLIRQSSGGSLLEANGA